MVSELEELYIYSTAWVMAQEQVQERQTNKGSL